MAELGAFFGNPNLQRQGARARALAAQRDVNTLADPRTYAIVQGLLGTAPDEMGFSVLNPNYEKIRKVAEPAFALGLLGQASPLLAPMTKGLPVGASIKNVGKDLFEASKKYHKKIPEVKNINVANLKRMNSGEVADVSDEVAANMDFSQPIKVSVFADGEMRIVDGHHRVAAAKKLGIESLPVELQAINAKGETLNKLVKQDNYVKYPQQEALDTAQRNAALPIEEGGLGLPKDNTPEMRAAVMFPTDLLHGTAKDFPSFDISKAGTNTRQAGDELGIFSTSKPFLANDYALIASRGGWANRTDPENAVVYPLVGGFKNPKKYKTATEFYRDADAMAAEQKLGQWREQLQKEGYDSVFVRPDLEEVVAFNPDQLRSRFAAFDPFRRDTETALSKGVAPPDLLAGLLPLGLLDEEKRKEITSLLE